MRKIKATKKFLMVISTLLFLLFFSSNVFAANYTLEVNFDGKNIEMASLTPNMTWNINKLQPEEEQYATISVSNKGTKSVDVEFSGSIIDEENLGNILDVKILNLVSDNPSLDEVIYSGKFSEMQKINFNLDVGKNQSYKILVTLPSENADEYKEKSCTLKLNFTSSGILDFTQGEIDSQSSENSDNRIYTSTINTIETKEFKWIFIVLAVLCIVFVILLLYLFFSKDGKKEHYRIYKKKS